MIDNLTSFIAYVCPDCSGISDMTINVFTFSGDKNLNLKCNDNTCNGNSGIIQMKGDKVKIQLKCPVCTQMHTFTISSHAFWSNELITFNCINSGITIFFAGNRDLVIKSVTENENSFNIFDEDTELFDEDLQMVFQAIDIIQCLVEDRRMICKCGSKNLAPLFENDTIYIECEDCLQKFPINPSPELLKMLGRTDGDFKL